MKMTRFNPLHQDKTYTIDKALSPRVRFPLGGLAGWMVLFAIGGMFVYRLSQTGGRSHEMACVAAIMVSILAAALGVVPVYKFWGREMIWVVAAILLAGTIRLLIGLSGVVIIIFFTAIDRISFVGYLTLFYTFFLLLDTWLALLMPRSAAVNTKDQESAVHGNVWDIIVRSQSTRRSGQ